MLVYTVPSFVTSFLGATFVVSVLLEPRTKIRSLCEPLEPARDLGGRNMSSYDFLLCGGEELSVEWQSVAW